MRRSLVIALVLALAPVSANGVASAATPRTTLNAVESQLMCDTCKVPLAIAESDRADQERQQVRELIARGKTKQQILDIMVANWGPDVLAVPKGGGASITVWAVPAGVIALVALGLLLALPRWRRRRPAAATTDDVAELSADDAERLRRDLAGYDL